MNGSPFDPASSVPDIEHQVVLAEVEAGLFGSTPGVEIDRYRIVGRLGRGGMGVVYRAQDPQLDRAVALKLLHPSEPGTAPRQRQRLLREARALGRLDHPNVVTVFDVGLAGAQVFVAMELCEGMNLEQWLADSRRSVAEIERVFAAAGHGLLAVHRAGLVHRDFKPSNVMVGDDGRVRVLDFGLAKSVSEQAVMTTTDEDRAPPSAAELTGRGAVVGTPRYMAPEQARGERGDARADQYAFCVALHEALLGSVSAEPDSHLPPTPHGHVRRRVRSAIVRGLQRDPNDRFDDLRPLLSELARPRRARWLAALGGAAVVSAAFMMTRSPSPDPCADASAPIDAVWSNAARSELHAHLAGLPRPFAADTAQRVDTRLHAYTEAWRAMARDNCEATRVHDEQSSATETQRRACLAGRADALAAMVETLRAIDPERLRTAVAASGSLPKLEGCGPGPHLAETSSNPADPAHARRVRAQLARVRALLRTHDYATAERVLEPIAAMVGPPSDAGFDPVLQAELRYAQGRVMSRLGRYDDAERHQREAVEGALEFRREALEAEARVDLMRLVATRHPEDIDSVRNEALAAARRLADPGVLVMALRQSAATRTTPEQRDQARRELEQALSLSRTMPDGALAEAATRVALGIWHTQREDFAAATEQFEQAYALELDTLGPDHPRVTLSLRNLAAVHRTIGDLPQAQREHERVIELLSVALPPDHPELAVELANLGGVHLDLGRPEHAARLAARAVKILERSRGPDHPEVAWAASLQAIALRQAGSSAEAVEVSTRVVEIHEANSETPSPELAAAWLERARAHHGAGQSAEAHAAALRSGTLAQQAGNQALQHEAEQLAREWSQPATE
ncbi:MAG: serine/threonine-protein kinase [Myxococcota bacterium]